MLQVACGGKEPVMMIDGNHYQYMYETETQKHGYYWQEGDLFLVDGLDDIHLPKCLKS